MPGNGFIEAVCPLHQYLTRVEAAAYLRRSVPTLKRWAAHGLGPPWRKIGGRVLYPLPSLRRFASGENPERPA